MWRDCWIVLLSRPARALWIEIVQDSRWIARKMRRGPRGPCGLKYKASYQKIRPRGRGPRGPCGLKCKMRYINHAISCRGPRGPCGLKFVRLEVILWMVMSRPARALWIEMVKALKALARLISRGPRGPCGLKFESEIITTPYSRSRPARALWIEIPGLWAGDGQTGRGPRGPCGLK